MFQDLINSPDLFIVFLGQGGQPQGGMGLIAGYIAIFMAIMYFMMIRPQQRRDRERKEMIADLKKGNRVMFCGGMIGQIQSKREKDDTYIIKIADNVKVEVHQDAVNAVIEKGKSVNEAAEGSSKTS